MRKPRIEVEGLFFGADYLHVLALTRRHHVVGIRRESRLATRAGRNVEPARIALGEEPRCVLQCQAVSLRSSQHMLGAQEEDFPVEADLLGRAAPKGRGEADAEVFVTQAGCCLAKRRPADRCARRRRERLKGHTRPFSLGGLPK